MVENRKDVAEVLGLGQHRSGSFRWAAYLLALVLAAGGGLYWYMGADGSRTVRYSTAPVERADFIVTVTATGSVEPTNLVEISSELSGTIKSVNVDFNDIVEVGTILAELDTTKLEAQLDVRRAALDATIARVAMARATLEEARARYDSTLELQKRGVDSPQALISQRAAFTRAQAELQSAQADQSLAEANLDLQQAELEKACICAPIRGVVLDRAADKGQIVASALSAPILFTLAEDLTQMELHVDIDEADIGQVSVGDAAQFRVDAYDERLFPAVISEIRFAPETIDGVVTYKAVLTIDNSDMLLRPGMTATADITVDERKDVLTVPNAALRYAPPPEAVEDEDRSGLLGMLIPQGSERQSRGDGRTLWVMRDGVPVEITVETGASDGLVTELLGGEIAEGDRVVTDRFDG